MRRFFKKIKKNREDDDITIDELKNIIRTNEDVIILDVRSPLEFEEGHLKRCKKYTII